MSERFQMGLANTTAVHWPIFERLASAYMTDEYSALRTLATPSGDEGRDAMLFQPQDDDTVAIQYSVQRDWPSKVRKTARRLAETHPKTTILVYVTPLFIGANVDETRKTIRETFHVYLDIRDQSYFLDRENRSRATREAAEKYCRATVDPLLAEAGLIDRSSTHLTSHEARAALLYLVLQHEDSSADRQLTKLCFDALVLAVLRDTDNANRKSRSEIHEAIRELLPTHERQSVDDYVDRALDRMTKREIRHWTKNDEYCLTFEERSRLAEGLARLALMNEEFGIEVVRNLEFVASGLSVDLSMVDTDLIVTRLRRVMEAFLFERGEAFVESLRTGQEMLFVTEELTQVVTA